MQDEDKARMEQNEDGREGLKKQEQGQDRHLERAVMRSWKKIQNSGAPRRSRSHFGSSVPGSVWSDFVCSANTTLHGSQSQVCVGGRSPRGGVGHDSARSVAAICQVAQAHARRIEARLVEAGTARQWEEVRGEGVEAVWSDFDDTPPSFPLSRGRDGCRAQSSGEAPNTARHVGRRRRGINDDQGSSPERSRRKNAPCPSRSTEHSGRKEKRVEARQSVIQPREALDKAVAIYQEQEAFLANGVKRLTALQEKERTTPSPFTIQIPRCQRASKPNSVGCRVSSMICRRSWPLFGVGSVVLTTTA